MLCQLYPFMDWGDLHMITHNDIFLIGLLQCNLHGAENHLEGLLDSEYSDMDSYGCSSLWLLWEMHWLPKSCQIWFKLLVMISEALHVIDWVTWGPIFSQEHLSAWYAPKGRACSRFLLLNLVIFWDLGSLWFSMVVLVLRKDYLHSPHITLVFCCFQENPLRSGSSPRH